jgi:hypothetical protein
MLPHRYPEGTSCGFAGAAGVTRRLTDIAIRNLKPQADRYEVRDAVSPLRVVVQPSGHKSFIVRYRSPLNGKPAKLTLTAGISLAAARKEAADALYEVEKRRDPSAAKRQAKVEQRTVAATTFRSVAERYMTLVAKMRRDGDQVTFSGDIRTAPRQLRDLERAILPTLGHRPVVGNFARTAVYVGSISTASMCETPQARHSKI